MFDYMVNTNRVIVAVPKQSGHVVGVFINKEKYNEWLDTSDWDESQLNVRSCHIHGSEQ